MKDDALISHGPNDEHQAWDIYRILKLNDLVSIDEFINWKNSLPLVIDITDFKINQSQNMNSHIHDQTLFQIVNETFVENWDQTSLFYSEKTFKPILHAQPFLIYGQQGCNRYLENMGYKLYTDWFDYTFDDEPNNIMRYKKLLLSVENAVKEIKRLDISEYSNWRFKNEEILTHNISTLLSHQYSKNKAISFYEMLIKHSL
jgi:hypothetical protein